MSSDVKNCVKVFVGFAWEKVADCTADASWSAIKQYFKKTNDSLCKRYGVSISFRRLRASHGRFIWESVREKIAAADVCIFDVAARPEDGGKTSNKVPYANFNANVLLELGAALAKPTPRVLIMKPSNLEVGWPSDLNGLCYTSYTDLITSKGLVRKYEDKWGVLPQYRSMVIEAIERKGIVLGDDDDDLAPMKSDECEMNVVAASSKKGA